LFARIVAEKDLQFYVAICMIAELALFIVLLLFVPRSLPFVDLAFYFSYTSYFAILTYANLNFAILDGTFSAHVLGEAVYSLTMWTIVFMVGAYLSLSPMYVKILFGYIFVIVAGMAAQNIWALAAIGKMGIDIFFRWVSPAASMAMAALLIQRMGVLQQKRATTDELTGLLNRHALYRILEREMERSVRYGNPFSIILFDVDHFKKINDTHGHLAGDGVLKNLSELVGRTIRQVDYFGRWGGEEFLLILPGIDGKHAGALAERLCSVVKDHYFEKVENITASFGTAVFRGGCTLEELLHNADSAMYQAKQNGRGQVVERYPS
jgi:diguanylate cyclase (GGDEF)-like protein